MRVECPCGCHHRFDVPIRAVLLEAERLKNKSPRHVVMDTNGNVLSPQDLESKRLRDEAVRKRMAQKNI